jgi:hypothetical protein
MTNTQKRFHISTGLVVASFMLLLALTGAISSAQKDITPAPATAPIENISKVNDNYSRGCE